ncbi:PREDICTED: F-box only protein 39-like [Priapulus caudatus]|uniref:F-box only protein 39-like n=1 Tax=Priapulus caudatus TaxID=37621 RepID=A0ABM1DZQ1_PRICU|nr:PREDICTED: F-box only protein 39-like [Priapulus caudatus]
MEASWEQVPNIVLVQVFSRLSDSDRLSASLVCQKWRQIFRYPSLWRTRCFDISRGHTGEDARAIAFARSLGPCLKQLYVILNHPTYIGCRRAQKTMTSLLSRLYGKAQLAEFVMPHLEMDRFWKYDSVRDRLFRSLARFLRGQRRLRAFDMSGASVMPSEGYLLLAAVAKNSGATVRDLNIEEYFRPRHPVFLSETFNELMGQFSNLHKLSISYNCMSDELLASLASTCAGRLSHVTVRCYKTEPHHQKIYGQQWKNLCRVCPKLKVKYCLERIRAYSEIKLMLVPEIPLYHLQIWAGYESSQIDWRVCDTIDYITTNFCDTLEHVSLEYDESTEFIDDRLLALVSRCRHLEHMDVNAVLQLATVDTLLNQQKEYKIGLLGCHIVVCGLTEHGTERLSDIMQQHQEWLDERGVDFRCTSDHALHHQ